MVPEVEDQFASWGFRFNSAKSATARTHAAATFAVGAQSTLKVQSLRLLVLGTLGLSRTNVIVVDVNSKTWSMPIVTLRRPGGHEGECGWPGLSEFASTSAEYRPIFLCLSQPLSKASPLPIRTKSMPLGGNLGNVGPPRSAW